MNALPFDECSFDAIWSEGAIDNMGFQDGITTWRRFLKPGGILAVSELIWLTHERSDALEQHWMKKYPEVATVSAKMAKLEEVGYSPIGYFSLPQRCWLDNYYRPMQARFADFLSRNGHSDPARAIVEAEGNEITLYERYSDYYGYGYFLAKKIAA